MAKVHNKAAQWQKNTFISHYNRTFAIVGVFLVVLGVLLGVLFCDARVPGVALTIIVILATLYLALVRLEPFLERLQKQRLKFLRGARMEGLVAWLLVDLEGNYHLFNNLKIRPNEDIDHILIGPPGVFAISTKSQRGLLTTDSHQNLCHNHQPIEWGRDALRLAMTLRDRIVTCSS